MLFKLIFDGYPDNVVYLVRRVLICVHANGAYETKRLAMPPKAWLEWASAHGSVDKVVEPERKMFWLAFGHTLRAMGVIK